MSVEDLLGSLKGNLDVTITLDVPTQEITTEQAINKMAIDVLAGKYGSGSARKENLYSTIQTEVNKIVNEKTKE